MTLLYNKYWESANWVGFTATPMTANGYRLEGWDKTIYEYQTTHLIDMGYLADYDYYAPVEVDLSSLRNDYSSGDFKKEDIEEVTNEATAIKSVKKQWKKYSKGKKTLVFASSITHAILLQKALKGSFIIHSNMTDVMQSNILNDFKYSKSATMINVAILTTGFDDPTVDLLIIARPIRSDRLAMQCWGRALRLLGNKRATILDMCSVYKSCGLPKDLRDFNRVKGEVVEKDIDENEEILVPNLKCPQCKCISPRIEFKVKKKTSKTAITTKLYCPECGKLADMRRKELSITDELSVVGEAKVNKLSYKERKEFLVPLIKEFTNAKESWSHYILTAINTTGRGELFDQEVAKSTQDKTKWNNIMKLFEASK